MPKSRPGPVIVVLAETPNDDRTVTQMIGTVEYDQAHVVVAADQLDNPNLQVLYDHVADMRRNAWTVKRQSRRDEMKERG